MLCEEERASLLEKEGTTRSLLVQTILNAAAKARESKVRLLLLLFLLLPPSYEEASRVKKFEKEKWLKRHSGHRL